MSEWQVEIELAKGGGGKEDAALPVFLQVARAIAADIRRGRLRSGDRLPSSRALARSLGVHRNTVLRAYAELAAEGWISTEQARATFVSFELPEPRGRALAGIKKRSRGRRTELAFELPAARSLVTPPPSPPVTIPKGVIPMVGGLPDIGLVPASDLARAYRRALRDQGRTLLDYGDPRGHPRLREALVEMLSATRGVLCQSDELVVTRGSQMALYLLARALCVPGDVIAVEAYGYPPAWQTFRMAGAELMPIAVDREGLRVDRLAALLERRCCRAVYLTPHHQFPTTVTLSAARRLELLELASRHRFAIIEDDYDHEFHYEARPVLPLASADEAGVVIYVGTLSKVLAPGLRIGFVHAPASLLERVIAFRTYVDHQGDLAIEAAVAELIEDGDLGRHVRRARRIYQGRRDALVRLLREHLDGALSFRVPPGGMALWARTDESLPAEALADRALVEGVAIASARRYTFDGRRQPFVRLGFARLDERSAEQGVAMLARAARQVRAARGSS